MTQECLVVCATDVDGDVLRCSLKSLKETTTKYTEMQKKLLILMRFS